MMCLLKTCTLLSVPKARLFQGLRIRVCLSSCCRGGCTASQQNAQHISVPTRTCVLSSINMMWLARESHRGYCIRPLVTPNENDAVYHCKSTPGIGETSCVACVQDCSWSKSPAQLNTKDLGIHEAPLSRFSWALHVCVQVSCQEDGSVGMGIGRLSIRRACSHNSRYLVAYYSNARWHSGR